MTDQHTPHPRIAEREKAGPHTTKAEQTSLNGKIAILITNMVGTMWCAYAFALLALISLPQAIQGGTAPLIAWIAQTFLQLVLLSVIMVGQKVSAAASDKQALQTYNGRRGAAENPGRRAPPDQAQQRPDRADPCGDLYRRRRWRR